MSSPFRFTPWILVGGEGFPDLPTRNRKNAREPGYMLLDSTVMTYYDCAFVMTGKPLLIEQEAYKNDPWSRINLRHTTPNSESLLRHYSKIC